MGIPLTLDEAVGVGVDLGLREEMTEQTTERATASS